MILVCQGREISVFWVQQPIDRWGDVIQLKTMRLMMRSFRQEDAGPLHLIFSDAEAMRYWSTPTHEKLEDTEEFVKKTIEATLNRAGVDFVVVLEDRIIGKMGLWNGNELGFIFAPDTWGNGYAREALQGVVKFAETKGLDAIRADVDPRNERAIKLLMSNGFVLTGQAKNTFKVGENWVDSHYFELRLPADGLAHPARA